MTADPRWNASGPHTRRVETLAELRDRPPEPLPLLGGRRLVRGETLSTTARAGVGKTTWMRGVVLHGAAGRPHCGLDFTAPVRFLCFSGEGAAALWQEAMLRGARHLELDEEALARIVVVEGGGATGLRLNRRDHFDQIRAILDAEAVRIGLDVVVFDPFQRFAPGDENSSRDMGAAVDALLDLNREFKIATIVPHHSSQAGKGLDAFRGHTTFEGGLATGLVLTAPEPGERLRLLEAPKVRYARKLADYRKIALDFDFDSGLYVEREQLGAKTKTGKLIEAIADGDWHRAADLHKALGVARTTFLESYVGPAAVTGEVETQKGDYGALEVRLTAVGEQLFQGVGEGRNGVTE